MIFSTVLPGLWGLTLPIPFPIGSVTCYLVEGDPVTLIDCGTQTDECYAALRAALAEKGYQIKDVKRLIITHHHSDHLGLAARIVRESGAKVWASHETVPWLEEPEQARQQLQSFTEPLFRQGGVPADRLTTLELVSQFLATLSGTAKVDQTLAEGDRLDMLGCSWRVYHTPGHAGDLICFYQPETRVLLSSDHLLKDVSSNALIEAP